MNIYVDDDGVRRAPASEAFQLDRGSPSGRSPGPRQRVARPRRAASRQALRRAAPGRARGRQRDARAGRGAPAPAPRVGEMSDVFRQAFRRVPGAVAVVSAPARGAPGARSHPVRLRIPGHGMRSPRWAPRSSRSRCRRGDPYRVAGHRARRRGVGAVPVPERGQAERGHRLPRRRRRAGDRARAGVGRHAGGELPARAAWRSHGLDWESVHARYPRAHLRLDLRLRGRRAGRGQGRVRPHPPGRERRHERHRERRSPGR